MASGTINVSALNDLNEQKMRTLPVSSFGKF